MTRGIRVLHRPLHRWSILGTDARRLLGAEAIRIEKLEGTEDRWFTPVADGGEGAMFLQMGRNKLSLTLHSTKPARPRDRKKVGGPVLGRALSNLPYEDLQIMGIDYETISAAFSAHHPGHHLDFRFGGPLRHALWLRHDRPGDPSAWSGDGKAPRPPPQRPVRRFRLRRS